MSRPAGGEVLTFNQEYDKLVGMKKEIEAQLSGYSKIAFRKEQSKIRAAGGDTLGNWLKKSAQMDTERTALVVKKVEIEKRMAFIAGRARDERVSKSNSEGPRPIFEEMLSELKLIRALLEKRTGGQQ